MVQIARPSSDSSRGSWTTQSGGTTNLYATIDEATADDADYVQSSASPSSPDVYEVALGSLTDPSSSSGHHVRYRYKKSVSGGDRIDLTVTLRQGASTTIASWTHTDIGSTYTDADQTLTSGDADAISDYTALRLRFSAVAVTATPTFRSITTMTDQTTASLVVTKPSGTADGDLLFFALALASDTYTPTPPGGWTEFYNNAANGQRLILYYKLASSEGASYTWGFSPTAILSCDMLAIQNIAQSSPLDVHSEAAISSDTNFAATSVTTTAANDFLIGVYVSTGSRTFTPPSGMTERADHGGGPSIEVTTELVAASGATGTRTAVASATASGWACLAAFKGV